MGRGGLYRHWKQLISKRKKRKKKNRDFFSTKRIVAIHQLTTFPSGTFSLNHTYEDAHFVKTDELMRGISTRVCTRGKQLKLLICLAIMQISMHNHHEI